MANAQTDENMKSEMLKLIDFYDQVSSREDALKKKVTEIHDKRSKVMEQMNSLHSKVQSDRQIERAGLQGSIKLH